MADFDEDELLADLGLEITPLKTSARSAREERIIAGFEDVLRFQKKYGRAPLHGEERDIFERLYAVRLDQLRKLPDAQTLLGELDDVGLLVGSTNVRAAHQLPDEDALLAELMDAHAHADQGDVAVLRNVRPYLEIKAAEAVANRTPCVDFDLYKPLIETAANGVQVGTWISKPFSKNASIEKGDFFIIGGQIAYVAEMHKGNTTKDGRDNPRLRVIFDNETESNLLLRSLSRSLYPDGNLPVGRRLIRRDRKSVV